MSLAFTLFRNDIKLEACLLSDPAHITPGAVGDHVSKIQQALIRLDKLVIDPSELLAKQYGPSTSAAVLAYKRKRRIINFSYQSQPDSIVGKMTIASLDRDMLAEERKPPPPQPTPPPIPPKAPELLSNRFAVRVAALLPDGGVITEPLDILPRSRVSVLDGLMPQCYQVFDLVNQTQALYEVGSIGLEPFPGPQFFPRLPRFFTTSRPLPLSGLSGPCSYKTFFEGGQTSFLTLQVAMAPVEMFIHLNDPSPEPLEPDTVLTSVENSGFFQFQDVRSNAFGARTAANLLQLQTSRKITT